MTATEAILMFTEDNRWLSNFYESSMTIDGITYKSNEHFYQSRKCPKRFWAYMGQCIKPKAEGRKIPLPLDWEDKKVDVMLTGLRAKFKDPVLRQKLLNTDNMLLVEGNYWHDNFWGSCFCKKCIELPYQNTLGTLLMQVREELQNEVNIG